MPPFNTITCSTPDRPTSKRSRCSLRLVSTSGVRPAPTTADKQALQMLLAAGEHQWRPARADNFENVGNDLTIALWVGHERSVRVVNRELGRVHRRVEGGISRNRQVPKRRATNKARSVGTARVAKMAGAASS